MKWPLRILALAAILAAFHIGMEKDRAALCGNDANMMECE